MDESNRSLVSKSHYSGWRLGVVIACLYFGSLLMALDTNIVNVAVPRISTDFHALQDVAWYGTAYLVALTALQPIWGSFYKFFRTDVVYRISIVVFEVGSILCAAARNSPMFILGRAVAGLGAAGVLQGALSIISQIVPLEKRPLYMGIVISVFVITVCVGPPLGGVFTEHSTWRWCFWINLPFGVLVLLGLTIFLKIKGQENGYRRLPLRAKLNDMDPIGCVIFIGAVCCLLLALQWGGQSKPWDSSTIIGLLIGSVVLMFLFAYLQCKRGDKALIPVRVFRRRSVFTSAMVLFFLGGSNYLNTFFLPFYFQAVHNLSPVSSGVDFIPMFLSQMVALIITGAVVKQWGHYVPYMIAGELLCIAGTALLTQLHPNTPTVAWAAYLVITGIGMGMAMQLPYTAIQVTLLDDDLPTGNAIAVLFFQLGGAIAISMGQTVVLNTIVQMLPGELPDLSPNEVLTAGAANLSALAHTPASLNILRLIWNTGVSRTMMLSVALVGASVPFTLCMEWLNAKKVALARKPEDENPEPESIEMDAESIEQPGLEKSCTYEGHP